MMDKNKPWYLKTKYWIFIILIGFFLWIPIQCFHRNYRIEQLGSVGDFFGGTAGPIFSFASFILLIVTFRIQNESLNQARQEQDRQKKYIALQGFENTFFKMVSLHHQIVNDMIHRQRGRSNAIIIRGRPAFSYLYDKLADEYNKNEKEMERSDSGQLQSLLIIYEGFFRDNQEQLGHYFRNLYQIITLIDSSPAIQTYDEKKVYIRIIRAQRRLSR